MTYALSIRECGRLTAKCIVSAALSSLVGCHTLGAIKESGQSAADGRFGDAALMLVVTPFTMIADVFTLGGAITYGEKSSDEGSSNQPSAAPLSEQERLAAERARIARDLEFNRTAVQTLSALGKDTSSLRLQGDLLEKSLRDLDARNNLVAGSSTTADPVRPSEDAEVRAADKAVLAGIVEGLSSLPAKGGRGSTTPSRPPLQSPAAQSPMQHSSIGGDSRISYEHKGSRREYINIPGHSACISAEALPRKNNLGNQTYRLRNTCAMDLQVQHCLGQNCSKKNQPNIQIASGSVGYIYASASYGFAMRVLQACALRHGAEPVFIGDGGQCSTIVEMK